jgi:hypothetical protein
LKLFYTGIIKLLQKLENHNYCHPKSLSILMWLRKGKKNYTTVFKRKPTYMSSSWTIRTNTPKKLSSTCNKVGTIHWEDTVPHPTLMTWDVQPTSFKENEILGKVVWNEKTLDYHVISWITYQSLLQCKTINIPYLNSMIRRCSCQVPRNNIKKY